jgi:hypothetical protein
MTFRVLEYAIWMSLPLPVFENDEVNDADFTRAFGPLPTLDSGRIAAND